MSVRPSVAELNAFFKREFPQAKVCVDELGACSAKVRHQVGEGELRPGGTVSGPVMMTTADVALYAAILGELGLVALAVTTNLNINFLRKPVSGRDIIGVCTLLKVGKTLAIGEVALYSEGTEEPVAHAVGTYAIPPQRLR
ncbi:PaaI family thioesterase [Halopseudomonas pelagia]|uniref:PaaI family thioesterase n=1 Tax=Halopseudomonas pelagia TaxID=553151 RepID=UPI0003AAA18A|nr:PaaI family thioesterase [Halopseudomonas pelagia]